MFSRPQVYTRISMVYLSTAHTTVNINPDVKHPASSDLVRSNQSLQECKTCCRRRLGLTKDLRRSTTMINMNDNELRAIYPEDKECVWSSVDGVRPLWWCKTLISWWWSVAIPPDWPRPSQSRTGPQLPHPVSSNVTSSGPQYSSQSCGLLVSRDRLPEGSGCSVWFGAVSSLTVDLQLASLQRGEDQHCEGCPAVGCCWVAQSRSDGLPVTSQSCSLLWQPRGRISQD